MLVIASLSLIITYFQPLWRIDLWAPQYPEGLNMKIWLTKLSGDVDIINGLNHYIGMAKIKAEMFPEFKTLPYFVAFFIAVGLFTAFLNKKKMLLYYFLLLIMAGCGALYDFWSWGYDYGHSLSDDAPIKVPGMAYQPPLIGYKALLNFGAYSIPDVGGWVFVGVGIVVAALIYIEYFRKAKVTPKIHSLTISLVIATIFTLGSCSSKPEPINYGKETCQFCKMTIIDKKFGCEIITKTGKTFKYDDLHCLMKDLSSKKEITQILVNDYSKKGDLMDVEQSFFVKSQTLRSPMGGDVAAFVSKKIIRESPLDSDEIYSWIDIKKVLSDEK